MRIFISSTSPTLILRCTSTPSSLSLRPRPFQTMTLRNKKQRSWTCARNLQKPSKLWLLLLKETTKLSQTRIKIQYLYKNWLLLYVSYILFSHIDGNTYYFCCPWFHFLHWFTFLTSLDFGEWWGRSIELIQRRLWKILHGLLWSKMVHWLCQKINFFSLLSIDSKIKLMPLLFSFQMWGGTFMIVGPGGQTDCTGR